MNTSINLLEKFDQLRKKAEEFIKSQPNDINSAPSDMLDLIHELRIHQVELEIQNEELQKTQDELYELYNEYHELYENASCGYVTINSQGIISRVNDAAINILGKNKVTLLNLSLTRCLPSFYANTFLDARQKATITGEKQSIEVKIKNQSTLPTWVLLDIITDYNTSGEVCQWRLILTDNTKLKQTEAELKVSKKKQKKVIA